MIQSNLIMVIQAGVCTDPNSGQTIDVSKLEIH